MPDLTPLRRLDDRVLGRFRRQQPSDVAGSSRPGDDRPRDPRPRDPRGSGPVQALTAVRKVSQVVLVVLAVVLVLGIAAVVLPTDEDNVLVRKVLEAAQQVAGPFATVFDVEDRNYRAAANYGLGAGVYLFGAVLLGGLGRGR